MKAINPWGFGGQSPPSIKDLLVVIFILDRGSIKILLKVFLLPSMLICILLSFMGVIGFCSLGSLLRPFFSLAQSITFAISFEDVAPVGNAVEKGAGEAL